MARRPKTEKIKIVNGVECKLCSTCKQFIPTSSFSSRAASTDGLAYSCKSCERATARRSYDKKKKKNQASKRYQENKEIFIERAKQRYHNDPAAALAYQATWRATDKGLKSTREAAARRAARIKKQTPNGKDYTRQEIIERDSEDGVCICQICGKPILDIVNDLQIDHIVTIQAGGSDTKDNVRCTHKLCNLVRPKDASDLAENKQ